jgi:hypothetical protein
MRPSTESIQYFVYSKAGILYEEATANMKMNNTEQGNLQQTLNGMVPGMFRTNFETNYTLTFQAQNFEKNMIITLSLPKEIDFGDEIPYCTGL